MVNLTKVEPAAVAEAARLVLVALVGIGWLTIDETAVNAVATAVAAVASVGLTLFVRKNVAPVDKS